MGVRIPPGVVYVGSVGGEGYLCSRLNAMNPYCRWWEFFIPHPPYHSKYNPVEHCWGGLETHWSGALLTDLDVVREWTKTLRWGDIAPNVYFLDREYHTGAKLTAKEMKPYSERVQRTPFMERWSLVIKPIKLGG